MSTTVTWVLNSNSEYEISSNNHLLQLMQNGALYTNAGTIPSNFMAGHYIQTVDIDLVNDSANIMPIGSNAIKFTGEYDGGNFTISNWSYTDPNFGTATACEAYTGLFGYAAVSEVKNVRLAGLCVLNGFHNGGGMVIGNCDGTLATNIECDLSPGSSMNHGVGTVTWAYMGGVIGNLSGQPAYGITLRGELSITYSPNATYPVVGGVIGYANQTSATLVRNLGSFPNGLSGYIVGGGIGYVFRTSAEKILVAMEGDLTATKYVGGVVGQSRIDFAGYTSDGFINSMKGNITAQDTAHAGGIIGNLWQSSSNNPLPNLFNYMTGDITTTLTVATTRAGGIFGRCDANPNVTASINAMNGFSQNTVIGSTTAAGDITTVDTRFGLTFDTDVYSTTSPVTGTAIDSSYFDLPYLVLSGTDSTGVTYSWDFIFGNEETIDFRPRPTNIIVSFGAVAGAISYKATIEETSTGVVQTVETGFTEPELNIKSLKPNTEYVVKVFTTTDGTQYDLHLQGASSTPPNTADNYMVNDFDDSRGGFDLTNLSTTDISLMSSFFNDLFSSGDKISIPIANGKTVSTKFVKRGESATIENGLSLSISFDADAGSGQAASLTLSDSSIVAIVYDETTEALTINGSDYASSDHFILDGKKVTLYDV